MKKSRFTFIDLFAGIGGMRLAFEAAGGRCVFSSEWDPSAQKTYLSNFRDLPEGDVTKIDERGIPAHDILVAGFPCQPFSIAGVSKKNSLNRPHGFQDKTQGTLFFDVARIIKHHRPSAFLLENVKNLRGHDQGRTFKVILDVLRNDLGYHVFDKTIDARAVVPQHRERVYLAGFRDRVPFEFPVFPTKETRLADILEPRIPSKYTLSDKLWQYLQRYAEKHRAAGNGFGFGLVGPIDTARTLSARYYKDGSEILIRQRGKNPRRLTPRECARLMGFPESFRIVVADTPAYKQFGNSVVVPVIAALARKMVKALSNLESPASRSSSREKEKLQSNPFSPLLNERLAASWHVVQN